MTASLKSMGTGKAGAQYLKKAQDQTYDQRDDYYVNKEQTGQWYSTSSSIVKDGAVIDLKSWEDICQGYDPRTGEDLVRGAGDKHRVGIDMTTSAPKSLSILWASGNADQRADIEKMMMTASRDALDVINKEQLIQIRTGAQGCDSETNKDIIAGQFMHFTSREGDPNLHVHNAIMNIGLRDDGKYGCLEAERLFQYKMAVGAAFRASLSSQLVDRGFQIVPAGRDQFELGGIDQDLIEKFSKRSQQIEAEIGGDRDLVSAQQKQQANLETRQSKDQLPSAAELETRWRKELGPADPWKAVLQYQPEPKIEHDEYPETPAITGNGAVSIGASRSFRHENVISRKELLRSSFIQASLTGDSIGGVYKDLSALLSSGSLIEIGRDADGEAMFTTPAIADSEALLLRSVNRVDEREWFDEAAVDEAIRNNPSLSDEQRAMVQEVANKDGVVCVQASAGVGKTFATAPVVQAATASGLSVIGMATSYDAADQLAASAGISTTSIAKFRTDLERSRIDPEFVSSFPPLNGRTVLLVDESSMISTGDMSFLADEAKRAGTKLILVGDIEQLQSVGGGAALRSVYEQVGRQSTMKNIRRQTVPWQKAASLTMVDGDSSAGLKAYLDNDCVSFVDGPDTARQAAVASWTSQRRQHGEAIMVTRAHADVDALNLLARSQLRAEGKLLGEDITVAVRAASGRQTTVVDRSFAQGDQVRFGENVPDLQLRNGTRGTIRAIDQRGMTVELENGKTVSGSFDEFARQPPQKRGRKQEPKPPKITHSYAGTTHSTQGRTTPASTLYIGSGTDSRSWYVGLTRHQLDARVIVESGQLEARCRQQLENPKDQVTAEHMESFLMGEASRSSTKSNVADFARDRQTFMRDGAAAFDRPASQTTSTSAVPTPKKTLNAGLIARSAQRFRSAQNQIAQKIVAPRWAITRALSPLLNFMGSVVSETYKFAERQADDREDQHQNHQRQDQRADHGHSQDFGW